MPESTSERIATLFGELEDEDLAVSEWTLLEFALLLARHVRSRSLDVADARIAEARFDAMVDQSFIVYVPNRNDFEQASQWVGYFDMGLRAGDALHLAIAKNRSAAVIHTLDKLMIGTGTRLGVSISSGIRLTSQGTG